MTPQSSESLSVARSRRLKVFADIEQKMRILAVEEDHLAAYLRAVAPASVAMFINAEDIITRLIKHGQASQNIMFGDNHLYGPSFKNAEVLKEAFLALKSAWHNAIEVMFSEEEGRIEVVLKIP